MELSEPQKVLEIFKAKRNHHLLGVMFAINLVIFAQAFLTGLLGLLLLGFNFLYFVWNTAWLTYYIVARRRWERKCADEQAERLAAQEAEVERQMNEIIKQSARLGKELEGLCQ